MDDLRAARMTGNRIAPLVLACAISVLALSLLSSCSAKCCKKASKPCGAPAPCAEAGPLFVSELHSGSVLKVDASGTTTVFASSIGKPGPLKLDKNGNVFVIDGTVPQLWKIPPSGSASVFTTQLPPSGVIDLTIADDGAVYVLSNNHDKGEPFAQVWELSASAAPVFVASTESEAPLGQSARGFTFGPGGHLYLAMQGGSGPARVIQVTRAGVVSTFLNPELAAANPVVGVFLDVRFDSGCRMFILGQSPGGSGPNPRTIWKAEGNLLVPFVLTDSIGELLQLTVDGCGNLIAAGGGFGGSGPHDPHGMIQRVDRHGNVSTLAVFPEGTIMDIDDAAFDACASRCKAKHCGTK
jgi:hypothetical protein